MIYHLSHFLHHISYIIYCVSCIMYHVSCIIYTHTSYIIQHIYTYIIYHTTYIHIHHISYSYSACAYPVILTIFTQLQVRDELCAASSHLGLHVCRGSHHRHVAAQGCVYALHVCLICVPSMYAL